MRQRRPRRGGRAFGRALVRLAAVLGVGFLVTAGAVAAMGLADHVAPADIAIVPGNTVHPDGTLSRRLKGRLDAVLQIHRAGKCRVILVSGGVGKEGVDEARAMREYLIRQGVPAERIIQDSQGVNTEATARNAALAMRQRGLHTALAVTQYFHVPRLRLLLRRHGVAVVGSAHARYFEPRDAYSLAREVVALATLLVSRSTA